MVHHADTRRELGANIVAVGVQSMPEFWSALMLVTIFAVLIPVLPAAGSTTWPSVILPTATIAILQLALISRMVRRELVSAFASPYITVARSRGVSERELTWRYAMRNSTTPIVTALGTRFAGVLNGVVVVKVVFAWPGVGSSLCRWFWGNAKSPIPQRLECSDLPAWPSCFRHVIPNIVKQASLVVLLLLAQAVLLESSSSYLGAGPQRPFATWGRIIADGQDYITTSWRIVTLTGLMIVLPVVGVNLLGDGLRDRPPGSKRLAESLVGRGNAQKAKA